MLKSSCYFETVKLFLAIDLSTMKKIIFLTSQLVLLTFLLVKVTKCAPSDPSAETVEECDSLLHLFDSAMEKMLFFANKNVTNYPSVEALDNELCK